MAKAATRTPTRTPDIEVNHARPAAPPAAPAAEGPTKIEAVWDALCNLGHGAKNADIADYVQRQYGMEVGNVAVTKSQALKKHGVSGGTSKPTRAAAVAGGSPTLDEMVQLRDVAQEEFGGLDALETQVQAVAELAEKFGGLDRLAAVTAGLRKLLG